MRVADLRGHQAMRTTLLRGTFLGVNVFTLVFPAGEARAQSKDQQQPPSQQQPPGGFSISVTVPVVNVDVVVTDNNGNFLTGLKKENFRVLEDGVPQTITNFSPSEAPITILILMEFSKLGYET